MVWRLLLTVMCMTLNEALPLGPNMGRCRHQGRIGLARCSIIGYQCIGLVIEFALWLFSSTCTICYMCWVVICCGSALVASWETLFGVASIWISLLLLLCGSGWCWMLRFLLFLFIQNFKFQWYCSFGVFALVLGPFRISAPLSIIISIISDRPCVRFRLISDLAPSTLRGVRCVRMFSILFLVFICAI